MISCEQDSLTLQDDIRKLEEWCERWLLKFHPDKCHLLTLGKFENTTHCHKYKVGGKVVEHALDEKDLGVITDSEMSFAEHIIEKVRKANSIVGIIRRSFTSQDKDSFV